MFVRVSETYPANQWPERSFSNYVESNVRIEAARLIGRDVNFSKIRQNVMLAILINAIPAGNA